MGKPRIRFVFDYVDPGSWIASQVLSRWCVDRRAEPAIEWVPLELRTPRAPRIDPDSAFWSTLARSMADEAEREGIDYRPPPFVPWTRKAHELAMHAKEKGCFPAVHQTLFEAYFQRGLDIGRVDLLVLIGQEQGLEPAETRAVLGVDRFLPRIESLRSGLVGDGVAGIPTIEASGKRLEGLSSARALRDFLDEALISTTH